MEGDHGRHGRDATFHAHIKMDNEMEYAIANSLGNPHRDFRTEPLTQTEILAIIETYTEELKKPELDLELKEIYRICVKTLKKHLLVN